MPTPQLDRRMAAAVLLAVTLYMAVFSAIGSARRLARPYPHDPYEAGLVVEAWRAASGLPVYEDAATGHATLAYGVGAPYGLAAVYQATGPSVLAARAVSLLAALAWGALLILVAGGRALPPVPLALAGAVFLGLNVRTNLYFVAVRPDMAALLLATAGLVLHFRGDRTGRPALVVAGALCVVAGFLLKQTALMAAAVPPLASAMLGLRGRRLAWSFLPLAAGGAVLGAVLASPTLFHYAIRIQSRLGMEYGRLAATMVGFVVGSPLLVAGAGVVLARLRRPLEPALAWILAAAAVALPASAWTVGNAGATSNALLPAFGALFVLFVWALRVVMWPWITAAPGRIAARSALLALLCVGTFPGAWTMAGHFIERPGYTAAAALVRAQPGRVVAPEDPTVVLNAGKPPGRILHLEVYAHPDGAWRIPTYALADIQAADAVVDVENWWDDLVAPDSLVRWGFTPAERRGSYVLWRRLP